ncbi:hypothetical protein OCS_06495 [Ophiocordyceps sinensis CO18]|uniref:Uncharacterized protein n=1 Tax=Ophiocordyceps sinensis (strain Co18 / CGMCC 3.14243) TaxID=911162 RepID=T5A7S3_OPHSC|nr:hypothetical protein OCS_06495 [Ophiocordyceps sinensis CO18]
MPQAAVETLAAVRRRNGLIFDRATETPSPTPAAAAVSAAASPSPSSAAAAASSSGSAFKGTECFTTSVFDTTICELTTNRAGRLRTGSCHPTPTTASACRPSLLCTTDTSNNDVCMVRRDDLDTGGVVLAALFGALVALAIVALAFLCCRDRRQQKRFAAKAEALALARAHTLKRPARQDARTPLMRQQEGAPGSPNPFQDPSQP